MGNKFYLSKKVGSKTMWTADYDTKKAYAEALEAAWSNGSTASVLLESVADGLREISADGDGDCVAANIETHAEQWARTFRALSSGRPCLVLTSAGGDCYHYQADDGWDASDLMVHALERHLDGATYLFGRA